MIRRFTASVALAAAATVGVGAGAAYAYEPVQPGTGLNLEVGGNITFTSDGFKPGSTVNFRLVDSNGNVIARLDLVADANGKFDYSFNINLSGAFALVANGQGTSGGNVQASKPVTVVSGGNVTTKTPVEVVSGSAKPATSKVVAAGTAQATTKTTKTSGQLAKTGANDLGTQLWAGAGLLAAGGALVGVSMVRRRQANSL